MSASEETLAALDAAVRAHFQDEGTNDEGVSDAIVTGWIVLAEVTGFRDSDTMYRNDYTAEASPNQMLGLISWAEGAVYDTVTGGDED